MEKIHRKPIQSIKMQKLKLTNTLYYYMVSEFTAFSKVLRDSTNQKILMLIKENNGLSCADLLEKSEVISEGMLNYHLKVLDELLNKNEENQYVLTEKGQIALKLLEEFPKHKNLRKNSKQFWLALGLGYVIFLSVILVLYSQEYIDPRSFRKMFGTLTGVLGLLPLLYYITDVDLTSERSKEKHITAIKLFFTIWGGIVGILMGMIGLALTTGIAIYVGELGSIQIINNQAFDYVYFGSAVVIGCLTGYFVGKKLTKLRF
jgi:DNA-binding HxlR family transcriptional regulator